jgi:hypothetical protein
MKSIWVTFQQHLNISHQCARIIKNKREKYVHHVKLVIHRLRGVQAEVIVQAEDGSVKRPVLPAF